jgi:large subunit ribosomal protein L24
MHVRKNDMVQVIAGDDAEEGRARRVLRVLPAEDKVVVEGVNRVYRHMKPSRRNQQGGRLSKEMPISASNVLLWCGTCRRGVRVGRRYTAAGAKERYCKKCSTGLGTISKPDPKYAQKAT